MPLARKRSRVQQRQQRDVRGIEDPERFVARRGLVAQGAFGASGLGLADDAGGRDHALGGRGHRHEQQHRGHQGLEGMAFEEFHFLETEVFYITDH